MRCTLAAAFAAFSCVGVPSDAVKMMSDYAQTGEGGADAAGVSMLSVGASPYVRPTDLPSCSKLGTGVLNADIAPVTSQEYLMDCLHVCKWNPRCEQFTYNFESKNCYQKNGSKVVHDYKDDIMGGRDCVMSGVSSASPMCNAFNKAYNGEALLQEFPVSSFEVCVDQCRTIGKCAAYSYNTDKRMCQLSKTPGSLVDSAGTVAGLVDCDSPRAGGVPGCMMPRVTCTDGDVEQSEQPSFQACGMRCQEVPSCKGYVYDTHAKKCFLKSAFGRFEVSKTHQAASSMCYQVGYAPCVMKQVMYDDASAPTVAAESLDTCRVACQQKVGCVAYSYNVNTKKCQLHAKVGALKPYPGVFSAPVECKLSDAAPCMRENYSITTPTLKTVNNVQTMAACRQECRKVQSCKHYTYGAASKTCFLKSSDSFGVAYEGDRSASVNCDILAHSPCTLINTRFWGKSAPATVLPSAGACAELCRQQPKADHMTYDSTSNKCFCIEGTPSKITEDNGWFTLSNKCTVF